MRPVMTVGCKKYPVSKGAGREGRSPPIAMVPPVSFASLMYDSTLSRCTGVREGRKGAKCLKSGLGEAARKKRSPPKLYVLYL